MIWNYSLLWLGPFGGTATKLYMRIRVLLQVQSGIWQTEFYMSIKMLALSLPFLLPLL